MSGCLFVWGIVIAYFAAMFSSVVNADTTAVYQINESQGNYLQATLTHDIYRYSSNSQLQDVVLLDTAGNRLPMRIIPAQLEVQESEEKTPVKFYPVTIGATPDTWLSGKTQIRIDQSAISINIDNAGPEQGVSQPQTVDFYLLDISEMDTRIDGLTLEWQTSDISQYLDVELSGTRDLRNWTPIAQETLVHLHKDGQTLTRNQIPLSLKENQYKYLRIKFLRGAENLLLTHIFALRKIHTTARVAADIWQVDGAVAQDQNTALQTPQHAKPLPVNAWEYQREERTPIRKFQLAMDNVTYGDNITVFSRATEKQPWKLIHRGIWFSARVGGDWQQSDAININANSDRYWRVELNQSLSTSANPALVFEHPPQRLQFIANNSAPYTVAIDHKAAGHNPGAKIFAELTENKNPEWIEVSLIELKPDIANFATTAHFNWQTALFWGLLLIAVAVLVGFSVRLYRQMN